MKKLDEIVFFAGYEIINDYYNNNLTCGTIYLTGIKYILKISENDVNYKYIY